MNYNIQHSTDGINVYSLFSDMYPLSTEVKRSVDDSVVVMVKVIASGKTTWMS